MTVIDTLSKLLAEATPGPWYNDCGNGQVESRDKKYYRAVVCDRAESFQWNPTTNTGSDPRYECCPDVKSIDPESDMELICALRNHAPALLEVVRAALPFAHHSNNLRDAFAALEASDE